MREISSVPEAIRQKVINNGGGHANHSMFWEIMSPKGGGDPTGPLADAIKATFTDFANFKAKIKESALARFGSGWAWLVAIGGKLAIESTLNQDSPLMTGKTPILGVDVWEHAYYLRYQNKRADYVEAWWKVVDWSKIGRPRFLPRREVAGGLSRLRLSESQTPKPQAANPITSQLALARANSCAYILDLRFTNRRSNRASFPFTPAYLRRRSVRGYHLHGPHHLLVAAQENPGDAARSR